jgi:riboflavin kinase / FMN adenylyltransferase
MKEYKISGLKKTTKIKTLGIGVFDGLHIGHQKIADKCSHILTFYPHPDLVLSKNKKLKMLTTLREMRFYLPRLLVQHFTKKTALLSPISFLEEVLAKLNPKKIVVGYDFHFGCGKLGNTQTLKEWAAQKNIVVECLDPVSYNKIVIKSSKIRTFIEGNLFNQAREYLGHPYLMIGSVIKGEGRGKLLGFPTANILVPPKKLVPRNGVYTGWVLYKKKKRPAMIYIGKRSTFAKKGWSLEVHILNFQENIYGKQLKIFVEEKLREDKKFENAQELIKQIKLDISQVKFQH